MYFFPWLRQCIEGLLPWGYDVIALVQIVAHPLLTGLFHAISIIGDEIAYLALLPLLYWCVDDRLGRRLGLLVFVSAAFNFSAKLIIGIPRPDATRVLVMAEPGSPSFPSGHAQGTLVMWGYLWVWWRAAFARWEIPLLILLVGLSRLYLGVHFPQDVLGGWLMGGLLLWLFCLLEPGLVPWLSKRAVASQIALVWVVFIAYFGFHMLPFHRMIPYHYSIGAARGMMATMGAFLGFGMGIALERRYVRFSSEGSLRQRILRFLLGVVLVGGVYVGTKWGVQLASAQFSGGWRCFDWCVMRWWGWRLAGGHQHYLSDVSSQRRGHKKGPRESWQGAGDWCLCLAYRLAG